MDKIEKKINFEWKKYIRLGSVIAGLFACLLLLFSNVFVVKENEYKVVRQFGEVVKIIEKPGLHLKIPFIQTVESLPKHQLTYDVEEAEINTKDKNEY